VQEGIVTCVVKDASTGRPKGMKVVRIDPNVTQPLVQKFFNRGETRQEREEIDAELRAALLKHIPDRK